MGRSVLLSGLTLAPTLTPTLLLTAAIMLMTACSTRGRSFGEDVAFLRQYVDTIVLGGDGDDARVAVVPAYQGRVMTSTATGDEGRSYGWINDEVIASGEIQPHINVFGGEDRFWLGPEGGQFALFFPGGASFTLDDWQTPAVIDTEPFDLVSHGDTEVRFRRQATLTNYSGTTFEIEIERDVRLLEAASVSSLLGVDPGSADVVAFETRNRITNMGPDWSKDTGLLSIWILGMYTPSPATMVVIPFRQGDVRERGPIVNDAYFGKVPAERLVIGSGVLFFSADGRYRSKIGLGPRRATPVCGSYDADGGVLTIVQYNQPGPGATDYVNSMWEVQERPYGGDAINSYNDGPPAPGAKPMGPFYELETSSPAVELRSGEALTHIHRTFHLEGDRRQLDRIATATFGVGLHEIESGLR
jgi:hypothetical protein